MSTNTHNENGSATDSFAATRAGRAALAAARAAISANLREPDRQIPFHWSCTTISGRDVIDINSTYPLVCAWCALDVSKAESLLKSALFLQSSDGAIAARYLPDGTALTEEAPWPLLIQATRKVWEAGGNREFLKSLLPRLYRYADWICYHFDPDLSGRPQWSCNEEALLPSDYRAGLSSPDLTILLLCELETLALFENGQPELARGRLNIKPEIDKYAGLLEERHWDNSRLRLEALERGGLRVADSPLIHTALLGMCRTVSPEIRIHAKRVLLTALADMKDPRLWATSDNLQINAIYAFLLIESALRAGLGSECLLFCEKIVGELSSHYSASGFLPDTLDTVGAGRDRIIGEGQALPLGMAALLLSAEAITAREQDSGTSTASLLARINRHAQLFVMLPLGLAGAVVALLAVLTILRQDPTGAHLDTGMGLANQFFDSGNYAEALRISESLIDNRLNPTVPRMLRAKSLLQLGRYDEAEQAYIDILESGSAYPTVKLNLALLKYKQNKFDEAISIYSDFVESYGPDFPLEAEKAEKAIDLLRGLQPGQNPQSE
jgi:tetratricopeptide (TPR) repeat protein